MGDGWSRSRAGPLEAVPVAGGGVQRVTDERAASAFEKAIVGDSLAPSSVDLGQRPEVRVQPVQQLGVTAVDVMSGAGRTRATVAKVDRPQQRIENGAEVLDDERLGRCAEFSQPVGRHELVFSRTLRHRVTLLNSTTQTHGFAAQDSAPLMLVQSERYDATAS